MGRRRYEGEEKKKKKGTENEQPRGKEEAKDWSIVITYVVLTVFE